MNVKKPLLRKISLASSIFIIVSAMVLITFSSVLCSNTSCGLSDAQLWVLSHFSWFFLLPFGGFVFVFSSLFADSSEADEVGSCFTPPP